MEESSTATPDAPDIHADSLALNTGPFGVILTLSVTYPATADEPEDRRRVVGRVRMSPELARALRDGLVQAFAEAESVAAEPDG